MAHNPSVQNYQIRRQRRSTNMATKNVLRIFKYQTKLGYKSFSPSLIQSSRYYATWEPEDTKTHTDHTYDSSDYRLVRFVNRKKHVNKNWAIKLIAEVPPTCSEESIVSCDGGGGPLGHPKVYINLDKPGNHACGYCGLRFYKPDDHPNV